MTIVSNATTTYFFYNIGYHLYSPDTPVTGWTGTETSAGARSLWTNAGADPKSESDERIYVDDSLSPAIYGTGTEDFYNAGWYFNRGLFTLPAHGYTAHEVDATDDRTSAYRLFMQDAIPFRKHIRAGIEDITGESVVENVWTLAYYYYQPECRAVLTDVLDTGNFASEDGHAYSVSTQTWNGSQTYTYDGDLDNVGITDDGRAHSGSSQFTLMLDPANDGAILRRRFDQSIADQKATVWVDGSAVGTWYYAGQNTVHRWRDSNFMIPASFTTGKSAIQVEVQCISPSNAWSEFSYRLYTLLPGTLTDPYAPFLAGFNRTTGTNSSLFTLTLYGIPSTTYDIWTSTNLLDWSRLGSASEMQPGLYNFTDAATTVGLRRFYRARGN